MLSFPSELLCDALVTPQNPRVPGTQFENPNQISHRSRIFWPIFVVVVVVEYTYSQKACDILSNTF